MNLIVQLFCVGDDMWLSSRVAVLKVCTISRPSNQMVYYVIVEPHQVFSYRHRSVCDSCCTSLPFIYIIKVVVTFFFFFSCFSFNNKLEIKLDRDQLVDFYFE